MAAAIGRTYKLRRGPASGKTTVWDPYMVESVKIRVILAGKTWSAVAR